MTDEKLNLEDSIVIQLKKIDSALDCSLSSDSMKIVYVGSCGGTCRVTCSWYCRAECEGLCGIQSNRSLNPNYPTPGY